MKSKFMLIVVLIIMIAAFTGCESEPLLPEMTITSRFIIVKEYHREIVDLVVSYFESSSSIAYSDGDIISFAEGINGRVRYNHVYLMDISISLDEWVAVDGTIISGTVYLDFYYYHDDDCSRDALHMVKTDDTAFLYFDDTWVSYKAEFVDGDESESTFISEYEQFIWIYLIVDGKMLVNNPTA